MSPDKEKKKFFENNFFLKYLEIFDPLEPSQRKEQVF